MTIILAKLNYMYVQKLGNFDKKNKIEHDCIFIH
jgi:hypothetical protein